MSNRDNPAYNCWKKMRDRCNNPANDNYAYYGGKGITVCARWNSFEAFAAEVDGKTVLAVELAEAVGADPSTIYKRIRRGWSAQDIQRAPTKARRDTRQLEQDVANYLEELKKKKAIKAPPGTSFGHQ